MIVILQNRSFRFRHRESLPEIFIFRSTLKAAVDWVDSYIDLQASPVRRSLAQTLLFQLLRLQHFYHCLLVLDCHWTSFKSSIMHETSISKPLLRHRSEMTNFCCVIVKTIWKTIESVVIFLNQNVIFCLFVLTLNFQLIK